MEKLTPEQEEILELLDEKIKIIEEKLEKVQPWIDRLNKLKATRRTLLSERRVTSGGGNGRAQISMEEVITVMQKSGEPMTPVEIGQELSIDANVVRSHLNRNRDKRYEKQNDGWVLIGEEGD